MTLSDPLLASHVSLVDAVDHLLNRGAVLLGDATLSVAGVDLVYVGLSVLVASVETMRERASWSSAADGGAPVWPPTASQAVEAGGRERTAGDRLRVTTAEGPASEVQPWPEVEGAPAAEGEERPERGLARLVLALVELLRQIVERQALRRMEGGSLSDVEVERMGLGLRELAEKMAELRSLFGLEERDLAIDLGPLGRLN
jgi:uncharacterized protein YjiS (DUF1127 family)